MPEGPDIAFARNYINDTCADLIFGGKVEKSEVSKNPEIKWNCKEYKILSKSRGKELMMMLTDISSTKARGGQQTISILVHFGMSGFFKLTPRTELPKHAHLMFHTISKKQPMTLSFVDARRFGGWKVSDAWSSDRGPDPVFEYEPFRENVLNNLKEAAFNKPICEVMLNQNYFNGIGNYLRAEILYRAKIMPFSEARATLENMSTEVKQEQPDLLQLCHDVPLEAMNVGGASLYDPDTTEEDRKSFKDWFQCYFNPSMNKMQDHNKRAIWFSGKPGPLAPKSRDSNGQKKRNPKNVKPNEKPSAAESKESVDMGEPSSSNSMLKAKKMKEEVPTNGEKKITREMPHTRSRTKKDANPL